MAFVETLFDRILETIEIDELGLEAARLGDWTLKTTYHTVFEKTDRLIGNPWGAFGETLAFHKGQQRPVSELAAELGPENEVFLAGLTGLLALRNHFNLRVETIRSFAGYSLPVYQDPGVARIATDMLAATATDIWLDPALLVFRMPAGVAYPVIAELHDRLERLRIGLCLGGFPENLAVSVLRGISPAMVEIERPWFLRCMRVPAAIRLLSTAVHQLHAQGIKLFMADISSREELQAAVDADIDYLEGPYLRATLPVGEPFDHRPTNLQALLAGAENVVPFRGQGNGWGGGSKP